MRACGIGLSGGVSLNSPDHHRTHREPRSYARPLAVKQLEAHSSLEAVDGDVNDFAKLPLHVSAGAKLRISPVNSAGIAAHDAVVFGHG